MEDVVIPYRPKDTRGTEIVFALGRLLAAGAVPGVEMKSFQWPLDDGAARYHLVGESIGPNSLEPALVEIDHHWRDHIEEPARSRSSRSATDRLDGLTTEGGRDVRP